MRIFVSAFCVLMFAGVLYAQPETGDASTTPTVRLERDRGPVLPVGGSSDAMDARVEELIADLPGESVSSRIRAQRAARALSDMGNRAVPRLEQALEHSNPTVRMWVTRTLGDIGTPEASRALVTGLEDSEPTVRRQAAESLERYLSQPRRNERVIRSQDDPNRDARVAAQRAMRTTTDLGEVRAQEDLLFRPEQAQYDAALSQVKESSTPQEYRNRMLEYMRDDEDPVLRLTALRQVLNGPGGSERAIPILARWERGELPGDWDEETRTEMQEIARITMRDLIINPGRDYGAEPIATQGTTGPVEHAGPVGSQGPVGGQGPVLPKTGTRGGVGTPHPTTFSGPGYTGPHSTTAGDLREYPIPEEAEAWTGGR